MGERNYGVMSSLSFVTGIYYTHGLQEMQLKDILGNRKVDRESKSSSVVTVVTTCKENIR